MSAAQSRAEGERPLVAAICAVPLLAEAVQSALEFADVRIFGADGGDVAGLLRWIAPDAAVVDTEAAAVSASEYAATCDLPVLHLLVRDSVMKLLRSGVWHSVSNADGVTPEEIRNVIAGALFARSGTTA